MRLIDADGLIEAIKEYIDYQSSPDDDILDKIYFKGVKYTLRIIDKQEPVKQVKHGQWNLDETIKNPRYQIKTCSLCGCRVNGSSFNYCPNCGAKMDGDINA